MNALFDSRRVACAIVAATLGAGMLLAPAVDAHGPPNGQMGNAYGPHPHAGHGMMGYGMGPGMMGHGMGPGTMGYGMGPGMMGYGMGPGMMGYGMGPGTMGYGMVGYGMPSLRDEDLTVDGAKRMLEHHLEHHGNDRLRVGKVEQDGDRIVAEVETVDGSLVERYAIDPHTGYMQPQR